MNKTAALQNLKDLAGVLTGLNIPYWITDGTLLGFIREGKILDHDLDTDIGLMIDHYTPELLRELAKAGFDCRQVYGKKDNGLELALYRNGVKTDFFFFYREEGGWLWHAAWDNREGFWHQIRYYYPQEYVIGPHERFIEIDGYKFRGPHSPLNFLTHKYGDWTEVVKKWDWRFGPKNHEISGVIYRGNHAEKIYVDQFFSQGYLRQCTILIKSFKRRDCLDNLMRSIRRYYPDIRVIIVDDSGENLQLESTYTLNTQVYYLPYDSGLSACRNYGVSKVETPYFILCDDDFEFCDQTDIVALVKSRQQGDFDIMGGLVEENGVLMQYYGHLEHDQGAQSLTYQPLNFSFENGVVVCDIILNFFIAKTDRVKQFGWDDDLKLAEHTAYFHSIKGHLKVGYTDRAKVLHKPVRTAEYLTYRMRGKHYFEYWMKKMCINKVTNFRGETTILCEQ